MSSVNIERSNTTTKIYNQFYGTQIDVSTADYDLAVSFFSKINKLPEQAQQFAAILFEIAEKTGISVQTYIKNLEGQDEIKLSMSLAYYLNSIRSNSTLLGVGQVITPNYYAARNVAI